MIQDKGLQTVANIAEPILSSDSEDYDYSPFIAEEYWKTAIKMKRDIKRTAKQYKAQRKALDDHLEKIQNFFLLKEQDSDE